MCGCSLHHVRQAKVGAEPRHEIAGGDEIDGRFERLEDQFEAPADFLLAHFADGAYLLEGSRHAFLPARNVEAGRCNRVIRTT